MDDGTLSEHFWAYTVPQLVEEHSAVKAANKAVHTLMLAKQPSLMSADAGNGQQNYSEALKWYADALSEVRSSSIYSGDVRPAILCSMFFVIFETIHGDQRAAAAHLYNGQRMLDEFTSQSTALEAGQGVLSVRKELSHLSKFLARQASAARSDSTERETDLAEHWSD